jgi:hypothetical protein
MVRRLPLHPSLLLCGDLALSLADFARLPPACLPALAGMEFVGEVCADFMGLNDSQYQWIIDEHKRREADVRCGRPRYERGLRRCLTGGETNSLLSVLSVCLCCGWALWCVCMWLAQRLRRLRRLKALKAAREAREIEDMEGGAAAEADPETAAAKHEDEDQEEDEPDENAPLLGP